MKNSFFLFYLILCCLPVYSRPQESEKFIIEGTIEGKTTGFLKLSYVGENRKLCNDTIKIINGKFHSSGVISSPVNAILTTLDASNSVDDPNSVFLFIEPKKMNISLQYNDFKHSIVKGSITHTENQSLSEHAQRFQDQIILVSKIRDQRKSDLKKDSSNISFQHLYAESRRQILALQDSMVALDLNFVTTHPKSFLSPYLLRLRLTDIPFDSLKNTFQRLNQKVRLSVNGKEIADYIRIKELSSVGAIAPEFNSKDINGQSISLFDVNSGNYVLLDFWGSWCKPCRANSPTLIKLYNQYHRSGFDIIGIAHDDQTVDAWRKAVITDSIGIWHHILQGFDMEKLARNEINESDIGYKYGINVFPTQILIDKNGRIIARYEGNNLSRLQAKLVEIFGM